MPKCVVVDPNFDWQGEPAPPCHAVGRTPSSTRLHVRGFTKLHPGSARALARHLSRPVATDVRRLHQIARRHLGRAAADSHLHQRQPAAREGADQLLGLQHASASSRPTRATPHDREQTLREFKEMVARLPRRRARGHSRRRLQPHRRRQRARPDAVVQGHRQRLLLPAAARASALLHQRHRHRQHAEPVPSARHPDGHRQPALLGERDACRRLPLRSRHHPGARARRLRPSERLSEGLLPGSRCCAPSS